jgi:hypothetical protein
MVKILLLVSWSVAGAIAMADANVSPLLKEMKDFKCEVGPHHHFLMEKAHTLLHQSMSILKKGIPKNEDLLKETLKVTFCTEKYDEDLEGVEIIEPLFQTQPEAFNMILNTFSESEQQTLREDLNLLDSVRKNGNG